EVKEDGDVTTVEVVNFKEKSPRKVLKKILDGCSFCTCNAPVKISYEDILILEQFMREDGTILPRQITGLCKQQQFRIERCIMQAHWSGLFPDKTLPDFDRAGYKRFNRYWNGDMDMYRLKEKVEQGSWYYIKRYKIVNGSNHRY
ncbi:unnamed protein product, partial [Dracunculus medinensis]|uniref:28S ribosomal protein S18a, mitochondrial n=1 Tax=Dracunculus medinensis TaxID=318479 RepID=A0A0N4UQ18_DRAME